VRLAEVAKVERRTDMRRQPRIPYQAKIRLRAAGTADSVPGRLQNLSLAGAFVAAPDAQLFRVGSRVECRLVLGGQRRTLAARVAWSRGLSDASVADAAGAGLEFVDLTPEDVQLIERLIAAERAPRPVDVWFEGMDHPTRCHALMNGDQVELSTRLPFMRLRSSVRVGSGVGAAAQVRVGTLEAVSLEPNDDDGIPHLHLRLSMPTLDSAQGTIDVPATPRPLAETAVPPAPAAPEISEQILARVPAWITSGTGAIPPWPPQAAAPARPASVPGPRGGPGGAGRPWLRWLRWLTGGWRAMALGSLAGALLVSLLWSLTTIGQDARPRAAPVPPLALPVITVPAGNVVAPAPTIEARPPAPAARTGAP
jgi:hypothetical protein